MRRKLAGLIGIFSAAVLVLGLDAMAGPLADGAQRTHRIVADDQQPGWATP
ncbi:hypothetical protein K2224_15855 [Streptomyces sp. BHT-5-2]|uniref:hypothetical protein n=1 Tax=unclassified Streptomyces TaxID=2593676 RepID=UPI001C8EF4C6|nr:hypothetical protein [Streptomyces sp. BHT-5-2]QZL04463.1 hypothetical protein K2224_15855 [Streptomyces sp. BHT-5-2]